MKWWEYTRKESNIDFVNRISSEKGKLTACRYENSEKAKKTRSNYWRSDKGKQSMKKYHNSDKGKLAIKKCVSSEKGKKIRKKINKKYANSDKGKLMLKKYHNSEKYKQIKKRWLKTETGKQCMKRAIAKRQRDFKWIPLINDPFPEEIMVEYHHVLNNFHAIDAEGSWNKWFVIPIPKITHRFVGGNADNLEHWRHNEEWIRKLFCIDINELLGVI